ncbi:MAG TPA: FlgD immunoglobulin-like domain containing protein [Candidatus Cloacimonadota bacterium]|nr:FlgD immunoglobulin-like domain containing protein [Candidatus Cloacimonadota bacterium]
MKKLILMMMVLGSSLYGKIIGYGEGQPYSTIEEALVVSAPGDSLLECISRTYRLDRGFNWLCFDVLNMEDKPYAHQVQYFFDQIKNKMDWGKHEMVFFNYEFIQCWTNGTHQVNSFQGYKFKMKHADSLRISGVRCPAETEFRLHAGQENWIGYFLEDTQQVYDAFHGYLDYIYSIQSRSWSLKKINGEWPETGYTISPGEMVIVQCTETIDDFSWSVTKPAEPFQIPPVREYSFEEEEDYIPIYIKLPATNLPDEIAVLADGECKGAKAVQDSLVDICAYLGKTQNSSLEIEFAYYENGTKKRFDEYNVIDPSTGIPIANKIDLSKKQRFYYVSFINEEHPFIEPVPQVVLKSPGRCSDQKTIYYSLSGALELEVAVYDLKGGKVKILVTGRQPAGEYSVTWDGKDESGNPLTQGIYIYKIITASQVMERKFLIIDEK